MIYLFLFLSSPLPTFPPPYPNVGSALARRMKARDMEASDDTRDRQREKEEMDELKSKLKEEGHTDDSAEIMRLDENLCSHLRPMLHLANAAAGAAAAGDEEEVSGVGKRKWWVG